MTDKSSDYCRVDPDNLSDDSMSSFEMEFGLESTKKISKSNKVLSDKSTKKSKVNKKSRYVKINDKRSEKLKVNRPSKVPIRNTRSTGIINTKDAMRIRHMATQQDKFGSNVSGSSRGDNDRNAEIMKLSEQISKLQKLRETLEFPEPPKTLEVSKTPAVAPLILKAPLQSSDDEFIEDQILNLNLGSTHGSEDKLLKSVFMKQDIELPDCEKSDSGNESIGDDSYEINKILTIDHVDDKIYVSWKGFSKTYNSWITLDDITDPEYRNEVKQLFRKIHKIHGYDFKNRKVQVQYVYSKFKLFWIPVDDITDPEFLPEIMEKFNAKVAEIISFDKLDMTFCVKFKGIPGSHWVSPENLADEEMRNFMHSMLGNILGDYKNYGKPGYNEPSDEICFIYARQSRKSEDISSQYPGQKCPSGITSSLKEQIDANLKWASYKKINKYIIFEEKGISARNMDQPQFAFMCKMILRKNITIIAFDASRISRNKEKGLKFVKKLHDASCRLSVTLGSATSDSVHGMPIIESQFHEAQVYSDAISSKVRMSLEYRRNNGIMIGRGQVGFSVSDDRKSYVPNYSDIAVLRLIMFCLTKPDLPANYDFKYMLENLKNPTQRFNNNCKVYTDKVTIASVVKLLNDAHVTLRNRRLTVSAVKGLLLKRYNKNKVFNYI